MRTDEDVLVKIDVHLPFLQNDESRKLKKKKQTCIAFTSGHRSWTRGGMLTI